MNDDIPAARSAERNPFLQGRREEHIEQAQSRLAEPWFNFKPWPWSAVSDVMGGVGRGKLWYVCMYSGIGKTTLMTSLCEALLARGDRVYCWPLECTPDEWLEHLAARRLNLHPGWLATGLYQKQPDWREIQAQLSTTIASFQTSRLAMSDIPRFTPEGVAMVVAEAADFEADWLLIDHVDHLGVEPRLTDQQVSLHGNTLLRDECKTLGIRCIASSQLKDDVIKTNRLALHMVPSENMVAWGRHKYQLADGMLGGCWPIRLDGSVTKEQLMAYRDKALNAKDICEPNTLCLGFMKHRALGEHRGERVFLHVEKGHVTNVDQAVYRAAMDGIPTTFDTKAAYQPLRAI